MVLIPADTFYSHPMISTRSGIWRLCTLAMHTGLHVFEVGKEYVSITTNNHEIPAESDRRQLTHSFCDEFLFDVRSWSRKVSESQSYDEFLEDLPAGACRYAVMRFMISNTNLKNQRVKGTSYASLPGMVSIPFIHSHSNLIADNQLITSIAGNRSPDEAKIKNKMLYAASKKAIRDALVGIGMEIQGTDASEVAYNTVFLVCCEDHEYGVQIIVEYVYG
ncbi:hypothetical protein PSHT_12962 [Puccinia striiformis]|uniref:Cofilin n=1 Tax=Puccinia striiformis TaxID=27350 RepID=A0A2S4UTY8_9BASI|nr:hypothetical protein PSHT_12962 [Puccinia striiformis]